MSKSIPKVKEVAVPNNIPTPSKVVEKKGIVFSFEALTTNEYFGLDSTCANWSQELFNMLSEVSCVDKIELVSGKYKTYRVHNHEGVKPPVPFPSGVEAKDCYQIRISKSKGGIHGIFVDNVFYVIWLDPLHNMYPDSRYGGLKKINPTTNCCRDRDELLKQKDIEIEQLKAEIREYEEDFLAN